MNSPKDWDKLEATLRQQFTELIPDLDAWGQQVDALIPNILQDAGFELGNIKIPSVARVKKVDSFISKALYRDKSKKYTNPLYDINDKVGTRVILLTTDQIEEVQKALCSYSGWQVEIDKNISSEVELAPTSFGYLAVHVIVRPPQALNKEGDAALTPIACEIQLKTLFQHAYSEVSHSTVYKGPYRHDTELLRKLALSMAMMEAIDGYFHDMFSLINSAKTLPLAFSKEMTVRFGELSPGFKKEDVDPALYSSIFDRMYDDSALDVGKLDKFVTKYEKPLQRIITNGKYHITRQPIVLFVAYLLKARPSLVIDKWDFDPAILSEISKQMGISLDRYEG
jgi:ppGpp synthetase/RelA/SpoT-type nucleotidyltranferase